MKIKSKPIPPGKPKNKDVRSREHLTPHEVEKVMVAAKNTGRYGHRDATMMLLSYRHGLRISELLALQWSHIDSHQSQIHINRRKNGIDTTHPLFGLEIRALRKIKREYYWIRNILCHQTEGKRRAKPTNR